VEAGIKFSPNLRGIQASKVIFDVGGKKEAEGSYQIGRREFKQT
jgi:hypothetical protein